MTTTVTIRNTEYTINLDGRTVGTSTLYEITGKRGANGALIVHHAPEYAGRALVVGIAALERLNWWDITKAVHGIVPDVTAI